MARRMSARITGNPNLAAALWRWHSQSEQYYLPFAPEQADLNWENPPVRAELKKVCEFWADRGVDGCVWTW